MADLMGSYIPDLVLKIDNGELVQLLNHLPQSPEPMSWWQTFIHTPAAVVAACSAIPTIALSILTWKVTSKFTEKNHELSKEQALISKENKEISKTNLMTSINKYNMEIINRKWDFLNDYNLNLRLITITPIQDFEEYVDYVHNINDNMFDAFANKDLQKRQNAVSNVNRSAVLFLHLMRDQEVKKEFRLLKYEINRLTIRLLEYNFKESEGKSLGVRMIEYNDFFNGVIDDINIADKRFVDSFGEKEFPKIDYITI